MKLKVFLMFGASIVMTSTAFAVIWEKPIPQTIQITTVKNANDGKAVYLYNSDYKGFYHGAYDYGTRASVGNIGLQVKLVQQPSGKYGIYYVANKDYASPDAADGIWIDGKRANFDGWTITPTEGNYFKLAVPAVLKNGTLGLLSTAQDTRINLIAPEAATNGAQIYDTWAMVAPEEYQSWYAKNEVYLLAIKLGNNISFAKEQFPEIDITAEEAIYNNTSSTKKDIEAAINALPQKFKTAAAASASATNPKDMTAVIINPSFEEGSINGWTAIDALVVAAEQDQVLLEGELVGDGLGEVFAVGGEVDDLVVVALGAQLLDHVVDRLDAHDHAGVAAVAVVIHVLAGADAVFAEVVDPDVHEAFLDGAARDGVGEGTLQEFGHDGEYIDSHIARYLSRKITLFILYFSIFVGYNIF